MFNIQECLKYKRESLRLQIRKQSLNNEFTKKRNIHFAVKSLIPIDEILNQIFSSQQQIREKETMTHYLKLTIMSEDIDTIIRKTDFLIPDIQDSFCNGSYDIDNVQLFLIYFDQLLYFNELAYLQIKKTRLPFMNNLKLILVNQAFNTPQNIRIIINIFQSLLIDCPTVFTKYLLQKPELLSILTQISLKGENIQQSMIELFFHMIRFYNFEEEVPNELQALLVNLYFSIIDSINDLKELELLSLYIKSGKYVFKIFDQYPIHLTDRFAIYLQILSQCLDFQTAIRQNFEITIFYSAKVGIWLWRYFLRTKTIHKTGIIILQKIIVNDATHISKMGLEMLKEIIEAQYSEEFLINLVTEQFLCKNETINLKDYMIHGIQSKEESKIILILDIMDSIFKSEYIYLKSLWNNSDIFLEFEQLLLGQEYNVQIHFLIIEILTNVVLDDSQFFKIYNFPTILKTFENNKNQRLIYKIDNLLQLFELQQ